MNEEPCEGDLPEPGPDGAAVFPLIPEELGIDPLLMATLHAIVFLSGSDEAIVHDGAGEEALQYMALYLGRLKGDQLRRVKEDIDVLLNFAKQEKWPAEELHFLRTFLTDYEVGGKSPA